VSAACSWRPVSSRFGRSIQLIPHKIRDRVVCGGMNCDEDEVAAVESVRGNRTSEVRGHEAACPGGRDRCDFGRDAGRPGQRAVISYARSSFSGALVSARRLRWGRERMTGEAALSRRARPIVRLNHGRGSGSIPTF
jgi:hypothetical protein